jgi:ribosomal-protein-alanine N-acetyltransferase
MMMKTTRTMRISEPSTRRGSIRDIEEIRKIEDRAFGPHAYDYPSLRYMLEIANSITVVCTVSDTIVGYATVYFRRNSKIAHLESIAVDPDYQGTGIGKKLMSEIEKASLEMGCKKIVLETFEKKVSALKLYEKTGYSIKEFVPDYYHIPYEGSRNAIRFQKQLQVK